MGCRFRHGFYKGSELYKHGRQGFLLLVVAKVYNKKRTHMGMF